MSFLTNASILGVQLGPVIAQPIVCAYPISDFFGSTPRYLYYGLIALVFCLNRYVTIASVFLGAAVAYAGTAAIEVFILVSNQAVLAPAQNVSIPFISWSNMSNVPEDALVGINEIEVQPNFLDLDLDATMAVVVSAYLIGLPLQSWSTSVKSSRIIRYMVFIWNAIMFTASLCALIAWPSINKGAQQYRLCYAALPDDTSTRSDGWNPTLWEGSWNATVINLFSNPGTAWQNLSDGCLYPCFNTTQILRHRDDLEARLMDSGTKFAKLHSSDHSEEDPFAGVIYFLIALFTAAQVIVLLSPPLHLCSRAVPVYEPSTLWSGRIALWHHFKESWRSSTALFRRCWMSRHGKTDVQRNLLTEGTDKVSARDFMVVLRLFFDCLIITILLLSLTIFPLTVIGFICWVEWYILNDGSSAEGPAQVGQWSVPLSLAIVLLATAAYHFKDHVASEAELRTEIEKAERRIHSLQDRLTQKVR